MDVVLNITLFYSSCSQASSLLTLLERCAKEGKEYILMAGKGKRKPSRRPSDGEKKQGGGGDDDDGDEGATKTSKKSESRSKSRCNIDIFNEHAMDNAYYTCHNIQDVLKCRGFPWPEAQKKKKKGKKR